MGQPVYQKGRGTRGRGQIIPRSSRLRWWDERIRPEAKRALVQSNLRTAGLHGGEEQIVPGEGERKSRIEGCVPVEAW